MKENQPLLQKKAAPDKTLARWRLAALNPDYLVYIEDMRAGRRTPPVMPPRIARSGAAALPMPSRMAFPAAYDSRITGRVTPVTQSDCAACWATAAIGALESYLAPGEICDFSEEHLQLNWGSPSPHCGTGAYAEIAMNYFAAWKGPVNENDYSHASPTAQNPKVQKHVQNVLELPDRADALDNDWVKWAVFGYGGVYSRSSRSFGLNPAHSSYYNPVKTSGHAVVIVGWDDNFDRSRFFYNGPGAGDGLKIPPGDGAFIAKDNNGTGYGDGGYLYVSYYDAAIASELTVFMAEPASNYNRIYQHDPLGETYYLVVPQAKPGVPAASHAANVFTSAGDDYLAAVGFFKSWCDTTDEVDYRIHIHLDPPAGSPAGAPGGKVRRLPAASVKLVLPGYYTVRLPHKIPLKKGQRFSVVLSGRRTGDGNGATVAIEKPMFECSTAEAHAGESFVSADGIHWQDVTTLEIAQLPGEPAETLVNTNVCIKAFTEPKWHVVPMDPDMKSKRLAWKLTNEMTTATSIKPVAKMHRDIAQGPERSDGEVSAEYFVNARGTVHKTGDGWVRLAPGETVQAYSQEMDCSLGDQIAYNYYYPKPYDPKLEHLIPYDHWHYGDILGTPPGLVSTDPMNGAVLATPFSVITVTFDCDIKAGPGINKIGVTSNTNDKKWTYSSVSGKQLIIVSGSPFQAPFNDPAGTVWTVHLPLDAVTNLSGTARKQDYAWSFSMIFGK